MVESLRAAPQVPLLTAAPQQYLLFGLINGGSANGHSTPKTSVLTEEDPSVPAGETIDSLVRPLVESAKTSPSNGTGAHPIEAEPPPSELAELARHLDLPAEDEPAEPAAKTAPHIPDANPPAAAPPAEAPAPAPQPTAFSAPAIQIVELAIPPAPPAITSHAAEPASLPPAKPTAMAPASVPEPAAPPALNVSFVELPAPPALPTQTAPPVKAEKPAAAKPAATIATLPAEPTAFLARAFQIVKRAIPAAGAMRIAGAAKSVSVSAAKPIVAAAPTPTNSAPFTAPAPKFPTFAPVVEPFCSAAGVAVSFGAISRALELHAENLLDAIKLRLEAYESEIRAIVSTFDARPAVCLLAAPGYLVEPPAPPDLQWMKAPRPAIPGSKPGDLKFNSVIAPAQNIPLAGPCLPAELKNFIEAPPARSKRPKKGIGLPAWIVSLVIATSLFLGAGALLQYLAANREAKAATVVPVMGPAAPSAPAVPALEQHPFARFVEVTGLRVVADVNHRSQVQYIVVNHSATQLSNMMLKVAVRSSADPAGAPPLFTVSTVIPSLGPHQSKEIRTDLDSELRASAIPDWEFLRTEVHVASQN